MRALYFGCCIAGIALPYWQFVPWLFEHGFAPIELFSEIAQSRISGFAWLDVIVSAVVLLTFVDVETARLGMKHRWAPWIGTLTVGVSLGLPLFLLLRENRLLDAVNRDATTGFA
jgi:Protein of unknown function DUF2834